MRHLSPSGGKSAPLSQGPEGKQSSFSQSCARPSSGLSVEVSKGHRQGSSRHSSHGAGRPSSQMSSRLSVSRFFVGVSKVPSVVLCCSSLGSSKEPSFMFLRVAVSLISIEGDEKFATKHKVLKFAKKKCNPDFLITIKSETNSQREDLNDNPGATRSHLGSVCHLRTLL